MITTSKRTVSVAVAGILFSLLLVAAYAKETRQLKSVPLGIEIALKKPFYVPAGKTTKIIIRVPIMDGNNQGEDQVSAIRLEPRMEGDKVKVNVFTLVGEADKNIKTCRDWDALKSNFVGSYVAGVDEEVSLVKLQDLGVRMGSEPLTFRVVPRRTLSPLPPQHEPLGGDGCECGSCGGLICCPNGGQCIGCGSCGQVCCSGG